MSRMMGGNRNDPILYWPQNTIHIGTWFSLSSLGTFHIQPLQKPQKPPNLRATNKPNQVIVN